MYDRIHQPHFDRASCPDAKLGFAAGGGRESHQGMQDMTDTITVALWATNLGLPLESLDDWLVAVEARVAAAAADGAALLVMPELASKQWLRFAPRGLSFAEEVPWLAGHAEAATDALAAMAQHHGVGLVAPSMPVATAAADGTTHYRNRAWVLLPDGRRIPQDKLCLTPGEGAAGWDLHPGDTVYVIAWRGLRFAVVICLDIEQPALAARLAEQDLDFVLVPSKTEKLAGYHRVFNCARARAVELLAPVAVVGCIGPCPGGMSTENVAGAAVYLPAEEALGMTGVAAQLPPVDHDAGPGPVLLARDLPVGICRRLRRDGAEAWPGPWSADHLHVVDVTADVPDAAPLSAATAKP